MNDISPKNIIINDGYNEPMTVIKYSKELLRRIIKNTEDFSGKYGIGGGDADWLMSIGVSLMDQGLIVGKVTRKNGILVMVDIKYKDIQEYLLRAIEEIE